MGSRDRWEFPRFFKIHWQCLSLELWRKPGCDRVYQTRLDGVMWNMIICQNQAWVSNCTAQYHVVYNYLPHTLDTCFWHRSAYNDMSVSRYQAHSTYNYCEIICFCKHDWNRKYVTKAILSSASLGARRSRLNTLRPRQNGRHFADDIFKCIFMNENVWISSKISLKFVPKGPINNIPALVQIMAWCRPGDKPLSEAMMINLPTHICISRPQWVKRS